MLCAPHLKRRGILPASNIAMGHAAKESALMAAFAAYQQVAVVNTDSPDKIVDKNPSPGCCWLVGSGPGPLEHLTLGAAVLIQQAEVIVYDDLGTKAAVDAFASGEAELVYVGKRGLQKSVKQHEINALLVDWCLKGKKVIRLKGGCPSVFSRAAEEIGALRAVGVAVHMSPGVSSALAAPLLAGIPLTDKKLSTAFVVTSGHDVSAVDWDAMRGFQTIVFLMAGNSIAGLVRGLQAITSRDVPVAVIREAGSPNQHVWSAALSTIVQGTHGQKLSPCILVAGEIAGGVQSTSDSKA